MTILIIISIIVYLLSLYMMKNYMTKAHSDKGIWSNTSPTEADFYFTILPVINTICCIFLNFSNPIDKKYRKQKTWLKDSWIKKFYKIKDKQKSKEKQKIYQSINLLESVYERWEKIEDCNKSATLGALSERLKVIAEDIDDKKNVKKFRENRIDEIT